MLEQIADRAAEQLDNLPNDPAARFAELHDYDFMDPEARQKFQELLACCSSR